MADGGTWLRPTPLHRERLLDMERRLSRPRAVMYGALALAFIIGTPWLGARPLIPLALCVVVHGLLEPRLATSDPPEYLVAATVVNAQVLIGVGIALTGEQAKRAGRNRVHPERGLALPAAA